MAVDLDIRFLISREIGCSGQTDCFVNRLALTSGPSSSALCISDQLGARSNRIGGASMHGA